MEDQIVPEGLNEWQQIDSPFFITTDCSEFPPLDHYQGSGVGNLEAMDSLSSLSGLETSSCVFGSEFIRAARNLKNHILACVTAGLKTRKNGIAILMSIAASGTVVLVLASFLYVKKMQRKAAPPQLESRDKFSILNAIKEKDERIKQLLLQISQMNELLQATRKVPVIRVG
nr:CASP-like protein 4A1 isoform X1 [Ipomoea batatas]GMD19697.1 CASP-like protein 4A1 isoform X1 [Ipomoea batatas]GMD21279.1 CASP-like protein 4A1 isoform X1 [Ipomoea batatas]